MFKAFYIQKPQEKIPHRLRDMNRASDYSKIGKMLDLCKGENRLEILRKTVQGEPINNNIVEKFNPTIEFNETDMISMLYYLGYLTISGEDLGMPELTIPNKVMKQIERYSEFEDIKDIEGLRKYTIVVAGNELYIEEI